MEKSIEKYKGKVYEFVPHKNLIFRNLIQIIFATKQQTHNFIQLKRCLFITVFQLKEKYNYFI